MTGLNEFRLDLLEYMKTHKDVDHMPHGLHAVVGANENAKPGVIFVLKNRDNGVNINKKNRLHPFYLVYINNDGEVLINHLAPKELLEKFRSLCRVERLEIEYSIRLDKNRTSFQKEINVLLCSKHESLPPLALNYIHVANVSIFIDDANKRKRIYGET